MSIWLERESLLSPQIFTQGYREEVEQTVKRKK
jgi:hypothetical protein